MVEFTWKIFHTDKMQRVNLLDWLQSLQLNRSFAMILQCWFLYKFSMNRDFGRELVLVFH